MKLTTTLNRIRACHPCVTGWHTLLEHLGPDYDPDADINLLTILESNGVQDMLWYLRATVQDSHRVSVQLSLAFAERALPVWERAYPDDSRVRDTLQMVRAWLDGTASAEGVQVSARSARSAREAVRVAVRAAARATAYAAYTARAAAYTAYAAAYTAYTARAARAARSVWAAEAARAARAARAADAAAADAAARAAHTIDAEIEAQAEIIRGILEP